MRGRRFTIPRRLQGFLVVTLAALFLVGAVFAPATQAAVRLPRVFGPHMVLQQEKPIVIWGWAAPNEAVTVQLGSETRPAQANDRGEWKAVLPAMKAGGPFTLVVRGSNTVEFEDVMLGEVWLCSGQSNMEMGVGASANGPAEIAAANHPGIRLLMVPNRWTPEPQSDMEGSWKVCSPKSVAEGGWGGFSAAGYYFGRELHRQLGVTVGLIDATWGGTRIESWTPPEGFAQVPTLKHDYELVQLGDPRTTLHQDRLQRVLDDTQHWLDAARNALAARTLVPAMPAYPAELLPPRDVQHATALFNGMLHPLCPFALRGAIWYQGESNSSEGKLYTERMKALVGGWRRIWDAADGDFPFYFVQIAPYNYTGNPEIIAEFWEAQAAAAQAIPNAGMAVINDIGNLKDIHPANKQEVGRRLALLALARTYGQDKLVCSGPTFKAMTVEDGRLRLTFDHVGGGLASRDGQPLTWFELIDADEGGFGKIGVPTLQSGARFQQNVANLNVYSNVRGIVAGANLPGGNLEFWPNNYGPENAANVPNASSQVWDFGDQIADPADGYGSMQVHNHDAKQTLFALNHWREGTHADLGIGNQPTGNPDWTFAGNAASYQSKRLRVFVRCP